MEQLQLPVRLPAREVILAARDPGPTSVHNVIADNTVITLENNRIRRKPKNERKKLMSTLVAIEYDDSSD